MKRLARSLRKSLPVALFLSIGGCTYGAPQPLVRVANQVYRAGTDSIGIAVYAAKVRQPRGLATFPDGGP